MSHDLPSFDRYPESEVGINQRQVTRPLGAHEHLERHELQRPVARPAESTGMLPRGSDSGTERGGLAEAGYGARFNPGAVPVGSEPTARLQERTSANDLDTQCARIQEAFKLRNPEDYPLLKQ